MNGPDGLVDLARASGRCRCDAGCGHQAQIGLVLNLLQESDLTNPQVSQ